MNTGSTIPARLRALRERAGLSIRAMAERAGLSPSGYHHYENPDRFKDPFLPIPMARAFAKALQPQGIDQGEVLALSGTTARQLPAEPPQGGFSEQATAFAFQEAAAEADDPMRAIRMVFGDSAATPATYRIAVNLPLFGLLAGDVLICDMARVPVSGELVLATVFDDLTATSVTTVQRYLPPWLVAGDALSPQPLRTDDERVSIRYPVIGSVRGIMD